jgi:hypothetical protein
MKFLIHLWESPGGKKLSSAFRIKGHSRARLRAIKKVSVWQVESQSIVGSYPFLAGLRFPMQIGQGE